MIRKLALAAGAQAARGVLALHRGLLALADKLVPAQVGLTQRGLGGMQAHLLYLAARHQIADILAEGPRTAGEIAERIAAHPETVHRLMRALVHFGVFSLVGDRFVNNRLSAALRRQVPGSMHHSVQMFGAPEVLQALAALGESLHTGKNPFEHAHGMVVWDWLSSHPDEGARLAGAMVEATGRDSPLIAAGYPFGRFERICDVAGGKGALLGGILARHPGPRGVLFDEPYVVHRALATLAAAGVAERVECVGGSFFEAVPPGCDAYLLKDILHDWDDRRAATILGNVRRSATDGARLLLIETLLEPNEARSPIAAVDVFMLTICAGGRQRSLAELERLLAGAGFALEEAIALPSLHSIVVARAVV